MRDQRLVKFIVWLVVVGMVLTLAASLVASLVS